jgi:hypothetical protein
LAKLLEIRAKLIVGFRDWDIRWRRRRLGPDIDLRLKLDCGLWGFRLPFLGFFRLLFLLGRSIWSFDLGFTQRHQCVDRLL